MEWIDDGIVLSIKTHGETSVLVELFTSERGRHLGLVRGGKSRKIRPVLQVGNVVNAAWRARLDEHLGSATVELVEPIASRLFDDPLALSGLASLCSLLSLFAERDPHNGLYKGARLVLSHMEDRDIWLGLLIRFEMEILSELGFRLDFSECAATGQKEDLVYVSPKSGRAVSRSAGEPYKDKLLDLPSFLRGANKEEVSHRDLLNGFALTGFFFERHVYQSAIKNGATVINAGAARLSESRGVFLRRFQKLVDKEKLAKQASQGLAD